jgi:hypothetical protein
MVNILCNILNSIGMNHQPGNVMNARGRFDDVGVFLLLGVAFWGVAFFAPDASHRLGAFFTLAAQTTWLVPLQMQPAWCSLKIILFSLGLLFLLDAASAGFTRLGRRRIALVAFSLQALNGCVFLAGSFFFIKALL